MKLKGVFIIAVVLFVSVLLVTACGTGNGGEQGGEAGRVEQATQAVTTEGVAAVEATLPATETNVSPPEVDVARTATDVPLPAVDAAPTPIPIPSTPTDVPPPTSDAPAADTPIPPSEGQGEVADAPAAPPEREASPDTIRAESDRDQVSIIAADGQRSQLPAPDHAFLIVGEGVDVDENGRALLRFSDLWTVEVLRDGELQVSELSINEQGINVTVLQRGGALVGDFDGQEQIDHRFAVQSDFAIIIATGTRFLVARESNSPLEWVVALDALEEDLSVEALNDPQPNDPTVKSVPSDLARWIAPIGVPSAGIAANMDNVWSWLEKAQQGRPVQEFGEIVWPHADVVLNTGVMDYLPAVGEPFQMGEVTLTLDPQGLFGSPSYALEDCNGDGIQDLSIQAGILHMDFRTVLARVRALDVTVLNRGESGSGVLEVMDPAYEKIASQQIDAGSGQGQVLSLRSDQPYHYAELTMNDGCFLGFSLTPPEDDGQPTAPRPAVENWQGVAPEYNEVPPQNDYAQITGIVVDYEQYVVDFETMGFEPRLPGQHVHFFFNTVPPEQAGVPGQGPWILYGGPSPFTEYGPADRPDGATQMCVLVANPDHSVQSNSGNCFDLP